MTVGSKFGAFALCVGLAIVLRAATAGLCGPDLAERVAVPDSPWIVFTQVYRCSAIDTGEMDIIAEDSQTKQQGKLLVLDDEEESHVEYIGDHHVRISLPNLVVIRSQKFSFGPYEVTYQYLPFDDPEVRANFVRWVKNPNDPAANKWYEENILNRIQPGVPPCRNKPMEICIVPRPTRLSSVMIPTFASRTSESESISPARLVLVIHGEEGRREMAAAVKRRLAICFSMLGITGGVPAGAVGDLSWARKYRA